MAFNPKQEYQVIEDLLTIKDFSDYSEEYVTRPPYQRKNVWSTRKKQNLLDSLFRRFYVPKIIIREVRLTEDRTIKEIIDGQQRIITAQEFVQDKLRLPKSLQNLHKDLPGKIYSDLSADMRRFVDKELKYKADVVKGIEDPRNPLHQRIATEIFWRLQQGESLNSMEIAHARLNSLTRNFIVKYSDDISFDFEKYIPVDDNPHKHPLFRIIDRTNDRMQHLALMARFILLEKAGGPIELKNADVESLIESYTSDDGIGNETFEKDPIARKVLANLNVLHDVFKDDLMIKNGDAIRELRQEYIIISIYLLLRHLKQYYVIEEDQRKLFLEFFLRFHDRWQNPDDEDRDVLSFSEHRQQDKKNVEARHIIIRQLFFQFLKDQGKDLILKDEKRSFNEAERIAIYRRDKGICQMCIREGKNEKESVVSWAEYEADHVVAHAKGGVTEISNGQVLCGHHNKRKGIS
ncbi:MAG: DUF262 domain-containing protein [Candidatus Omnitrophica bacterium]|nr:DUF262 domain-containing protein [Candidatus Omnitrophota bacterium]